MSKFVNTTAMSAALVAVCFSLINDFGTLATFKRAAIAYFAFYIVGSVLGLVFRTGIQDEWDREVTKRHQAVQMAEEQERLQREAERQAERHRRKEERKKQLIGEEAKSI